MAIALQANGYGARVSVNAAFISAIFEENCCNSSLRQLYQRESERIAKLRYVTTDRQRRSAESFLLASARVTDTLSRLLLMHVNDQWFI